MDKTIRGLPAAFAVLTIAFVASLAGCKHEPVTGVVVAKDYTESRIVVDLLPVPTGKTIIMIPRPRRKPAVWQLTVRDSIEAVTVTVTVDEQTFNRTSIGDTITVR